MKPKIGQLCYFWGDAEPSIKIRGVLAEIKDFINPYVTESGDHYKYCVPLTETEIRRFR